MTWWAWVGVGWAGVGMACLVWLAIAEERDSRQDPTLQENRATMQIPTKEVS